jgi:hypothetical protein
VERPRVDAREEREQREIERFQDRHRSLADRVERLLVQLVILGLVALVLVQTLQLNRFSRLAALEGVAVAEVADWSRSQSGDQPASMRVRVVSVTRRTVPEARLLVDGEPVGDFRAGSVEVDVRPGQMLTIDGTGLEGPLTFRVVEASGLASPGLGVSVTTRGDSQSLGRVQVAGR